MRAHSLCMEDLIEKMAARVGIDREKAERVVEFLKEHASEVPALLARTGVADKLPGGLSAKLGGLF